MTTAAPARSWRGLVGVLAAQGSAWTGARLTAIALPWFVLTSTGSTAQTGAVVFAQLAPYVVAQALAGPLIDRLGPRRISITGDLLATGALALVPLLHLAGALPLWLLIGLVGLFGAADGPANAAKSVFLPQVTRAAGVPLERGTGIAGALERLASTLGPAAGGLAVAAFGGVLALWITAALVASGSVIIALTTPRDRHPPDNLPSAGYLRQFREGASFLRRDRLLRAITGMVLVTNLLDTALFSVLLPAWAWHSGHGPVAVGLLAAVSSAASIGASVLAAIIAHRLPRRVVYLVGFLVAGAPKFVVLALSPPLWWVIVVFALGGFAAGFLNPILNAVQFERIPAALLGRVRTLSVAIMWSGMPFGGVLAGGLISLAGLAPALLVLGGCYLVATMVPALQRSFAQLSRPRPHGADVPTRSVASAPGDHRVG